MDLLEGIGTDGPWKCESRTLTRKMVGDVAKSIAGSQDGLRARDIAKAMASTYRWADVRPCDRRIDRALTLLRQWKMAKFNHREARWKWIGGVPADRT